MKFNNKDLYSETVKMIEQVRTECIVYFYSFQNYDMDSKRDMDEIEGIVDAISHNRGFVRNGIIFEGSFNNLMSNSNILKNSINLLKMNSKKLYLSLSEFINITFKDNGAEAYQAVAGHTGHPEEIRKIPR